MVYNDIWIASQSLLIVYLVELIIGNTSLDCVIIFYDFILLLILTYVKATVYCTNCYFIHVITGVPCPFPPEIGNASFPENITYYYRDTITYQCNEGYWFSELVYEITVTCGAEGSWKDVLDKCICK